MNKSFTTIVMLIVFVNLTYSQNQNQNWRKDLEDSFQQFISCTNGNAEKYECSSFIGESIAKVYKSKAFFSDNHHRFLQIGEISKSLVENGDWTKLGYAYDQKALEEAQKRANLNKAVIGVYITDTGIGHIAVILPGQLHYSGSWGINVPNAASFMFNSPEKSFVDKGLSYAFSKNMIRNVVLFSIK